MLRTMLSAGALATLGALPVFLLGAQSVLIQEDIAFDEAGLGLAVGAFFCAAAVATLLAGPLADAWSVRRSMVVAGVLATVSAAGVALAAHSYGALLGLLVVAGLANAALQVTANSALARSVPGHRQGLAFGVKQSAVPTSIVLGGLAVPTIGVVLGWRWTYAATAVAGAVVIALALRATPGRAARPSLAGAGESPPTGPLLLTGAATAMANAAANALGAFLPAWAFRSGLSPGAAGSLAAAGALLCVVGRVLSGVRADRREGRHFPVVAGQLVLGAGGLALLALDGTIPLVAGALLAFAFGWSWPGLLMFAVVRVGRDRPATASGAVQAGGFAGGAAGPVLFGLLVTSTSYPVAWATSAGVMVVAAVLLLLARRLFLADLARRPLPRRRRPGT